MIRKNETDNHAKTFKILDCQLKKYHRTELKIEKNAYVFQY